MKARSKFLLILLAIFLLAAGTIVYFLSDDMTRWAVRDSILRAAKHITPSQVLAGMIFIAIASMVLTTFSTFLFDQLPYFRKRRIADQRQRDALEIIHWKALYGSAAAERDAAIAWKEKARPILEGMRSANRNFNAQAGKVVDR